MQGKSVEVYQIGPLCALRIRLGIAHDCQLKSLGGVTASSQQWCPDCKRRQQIANPARLELGVMICLGDRSSLLTRVLIETT